jgi:hypothetical protein
MGPGDMGTGALASRLLLYDLFHLVFDGGQRGGIHAQHMTVVVVASCARPIHKFSQRQADIYYTQTILSVQVYALRLDPWLNTEI